MAQPFPIHSWKLIVPCEVSAVKFGASSLIRSMVCLLVGGSLDPAARKLLFYFFKHATVYHNFLDVLLPGRQGRLMSTGSILTTGSRDQLVFQLTMDFCQGSG